MQIGWVDFSKTERDKVVSILRLLGTQTALDELGIGTVRDAFSDMLFPGISTLQTRAKYFVILPYLFAKAENRRFMHRRDIIRRIPDWAVAPNQNNHRIIRAFLQLQKERGFVCRPELEARCQDPEGHADVYVRDFRGNFASMKTDAGRSHGKVFRDDGYNITICPEVLATLEQYRSLFET